MEMTKIVVNFYDKNNSLSEETIWGKKYYDNYYYFQNIPFFIPNIAYEDLISVETDGGVLYFDDLIQSSNNSTIRIIFFNENSEYIEMVIKEMENKFCEWEGYVNKPYYAINVSKNIDYKPIKKYLDEQEGMLDYEESCLSDKHRFDIDK